MDERTKKAALEVLAEFKAMSKEEFDAELAKRMTHAPKSPDVWNTLEIAAEGLGIQFIAEDAACRGRFLEQEAAENARIIGMSGERIRKLEEALRTTRDLLDGLIIGHSDHCSCRWCVAKIAMSSAEKREALATEGDEEKRNKGKSE